MAGSPGSESTKKNSKIGGEKVRLQSGLLQELLIALPEVKRFCGVVVP